VLFTYELARRLEGTGVTVSCLHPGVVVTGFGRNGDGLVGFAYILARPFLMSPERGARTTIHLATSPDVEGVTGKYFHSDTKERRSSRASHDANLARRLWDASEALVGT
jgi:NAD(P)-dependent dehydrogenase (short-subunit alcohol dehydrogenase family)